MDKKEKILCVDDEKQIVIALRALLRSKYEILIANSGEEALDILRKESSIRAIISDQRMPKMSGAELLREARRVSPSTMRLLLTGYSDLQAISDSINEGEVFRFINKPWNNQEIRLIVDLAVKTAIETEQAAIGFNYEIRDAKAPECFEQTKDSKDYNPTEASWNQATPSSLLMEDMPEIKPAILVVDDEKNVASSLYEVFKDTVKIYNVQTVSEAIDLLGEQEIAVIISETIVANEDATEFLKLLKQHYPLIITIVLTRFHGVDAMINLINQGQIYRYMYKPVKNDQLWLYTKSAISRYRATVRKPELLKRHQVEEIKEIRDPSLIGKLIGRIKSIRMKIGF